MLVINIKTTAEQIAKEFGALAGSQLPFALARALTWCASDSQKEIRRQLPHRFIIRNAWTAKGVRIDLSRKRDYRVEVYTLDPYMDRQEDGGIKTPKHDKHLAIPVGINTTKRGIIRKRDLPEALRASKNVFAINEKTPKRQQNLPFGLYRRQKDSSVKMLYAFRESGKVKPRWGFAKTVEQTVDNRFERLFRLSLEDAIRTAK